MKFKNILSTAFLLLASLVVLSGCPKKAEITTAPEAKKDTSVEADKALAAQRAAEAAAAKAAEEARLAKEAQDRERAAAAPPGLLPVYFDYDRSNIRDDAMKVMKDNAEWLKAHPRVRVRIEGNCDERGTREYNQALGQRRSASARKYLTDLGVSPTRITLLSYGKEKPVCSGQDESCMQKNRRDDFVAMTE